MLESDLPQHVPELVKQNIVATVDLGCKLDLKKIALSARNAEYNPKRFQAVIMRKRKPKTTALIFSTGKMVVTGAKSEAESKAAAGKFAKVVNKIEAEAGYKNFKIQNIVVSCNVNFAIRLETLEVFCNGKVPTSCSYCPEIFPGLIYRLRDPKVVMLIFASGKVVITGAKNFDKETKPAWDKMYPLIQQHRSKRTATMVISSSAQNKNRVRQSEQGNQSVIS